MSMLGKIIAVCVGAIMIATMAGGAISGFASTNTSGWSTQDVAIWGVMSTVCIVAFLYVLLDAGGVKF